MFMMDHLNNKPRTFFQRLTDSITHLFPYKQETPKEQNGVKVTQNRRLASEAFGNDMDFECSQSKRQKVYHDLFSLPTSRIIRQTVINPVEKRIDFNDAASDMSDTSVSTSGVSSLNPRSGGNPRKLNLSFNAAMSSPITQSTNNLDLKSSFSSSRKTFDFMSSPARKILEKLDKLTTPITSADKVYSCARNSSYTRSPNVPINSRRPPPLKAITVYASSVPESPLTVLRKSNEVKKVTNVDKSSSFGSVRKPVKRMLRYDDNDDSVDLDRDDSFVSNAVIKQVTVKSQSTNTDESFMQELSNSTQTRSDSPVLLDFHFREPKSILDEDYGKEESELSLPKYQFQSIVNRKDKSPIVKNKKQSELWRCDTCFKENVSNSCDNCMAIHKPIMENPVKLQIGSNKSKDNEEGSIIPNVDVVISTNQETSIEVSKPMFSIVSSSKTTTETVSASLSSSFPTKIITKDNLFVVANNKIETDLSQPSLFQSISTESLKSPIFSVAEVTKPDITFAGDDTSIKTSKSLLTLGKLIESTGESSKPFLFSTSTNVFSTNTVVTPVVTSTNPVILSGALSNNTLTTKAFSCHDSIPSTESNSGFQLSVASNAQSKSIFQFGSSTNVNNTTVFPSAVSSNSSATNNSTFVFGHNPISVASASTLVSDLPKSTFNFTKCNEKPQQQSVPEVKSFGFVSAPFGSFGNNQVTPSFTFGSSGSTNNQSQTTRLPFAQSSMFSFSTATSSQPPFAFSASSSAIGSGAAVANTDSQYHFGGPNGSSAQPARRTLKPRRKRN